MKILIPILLLIVAVMLFYFRTIENFADFADSVNSVLTKTSTIAGKSYSTIQFKSPTGLACDAVGNLYVSDNGNNNIIKIDSSNNVSIFAGSGQQTSTNGIGLAASFNNPKNITVDTSGNIYVADYDGNAIRKITNAGLVTTLITTTKPSAIAVSPVDNNVYFSDELNNYIYKCATTGTPTPIKVSGTGKNTNEDGPLLDASYSQPRGQMSFDASGNLYVIDQDLKRVRRLGIGIGGDNNVTTIVSELTGLASCALVVDPLNKLIIIGDTTRILTTPLSGGNPKVLMGDTNGYNDGYANVAKFSSITGLALGPDGSLYAIESGINLTLRKISISAGPITALPPKTIGSLKNANRNIKMCTDYDDEKTCTYKWDGSSSNPCISRGAVFNFDTLDCRSASEILVPAGSTLSQTCKNYEIPNSNLALCQEVRSANYPPAPKNTSNILTRGNPGKNDFKACTSLTSKNCTILYNKNGKMQTSFPCLSNNPVYDFGLQACTQIYDPCCGINASSASFNSSNTPSMCKERMVIDTIVKTSMCSGSAGATTTGKVCCASSNKASLEQCEPYWKKTYKWISGKSPPMAKHSCPGITNTINTNTSNINTSNTSNITGNFIDYSEYSPMGSNIIMFPEDRIASIFNKESFFQTANNLNKPK